ncbi:MAG: hypothetical protein AB1765_01745 [Candidatus Hydrogenedentota bacterium]
MKNEFDIKFLDWIIILIFAIIFYFINTSDNFSYGMETYILACIRDGKIYSSLFFGGVYLIVGKLITLIIDADTFLITKIINFIFSYLSLIVFMYILHSLGVRRWAVLLSTLAVGLNFIFYSLSRKPDPILAQIFLSGIIVYTAIASILTSEIKYYRWNLFFFAISFLNSFISLLFLPAEIFLIFSQKSKKERFILSGLGIVFLLIVIIAEIFLFIYNQNKTLLEIRLWVEISSYDFVMNNIRFLLNLIYGYPILGFCFIIIGMMFLYRIYQAIFKFILFTIISFVLFNCVSYFDSLKTECIIHYICGIFIGITLNKIAAIEYRTYERWFQTASLCFIFIIFLPLFLYAATPVILETYKVRPRLYEYPFSKFPCVRDLVYRNSIKELFKPWHKTGQEIFQLKNEIRLIVPHNGVMMVDPELYFSLYDNDKRIVFIRPFEQLEFIAKCFRENKEIFIASLEDYYYNKKEILEKYRLLKKGRFFQVIRKGEEWIKTNL